MLKPKLLPTLKFKLAKGTLRPTTVERINKVFFLQATFNAFVEWVPMSNIMANDYYLVKCLCHLLNDDKMQLQAAECLLTIVGSKVILNP